MNLLEYFKDKRIYHLSDSDLDGISSRIIAEYYINPISTYFVDNSVDREMGEFDLDIAIEADIIIFTDITPTVELYEHLKMLDKEIFIFDHHITGKELLGDVSNYYYDITKSATKIFYEELLKNKRERRVIHQFVELVNIYDMWKTKSMLWNQAKDLHNVMYGYVDWSTAKTTSDSIKYIKFITSQLSKFDISKIFYLNQYEKVLAVKAKKKELKSYKEAKKSLKFHIDGEGNNYCYFECGSKLSFVSHRILEELNGKVKYAISRSTYDRNKIRVSLRSKNKFDVSRIAEKWGGGGHIEASAIEFKDREVFKQLIKGKIHLV